MNEPCLSPEETDLCRERLLGALRLQEIEGNPLTPEEIAMFKMFERERWTHARCREFILARTGSLAAE